jgi:hypothetical protein
VGTILTVGGIVGFFFDVDVWLNVVHLATGLLGLLALGYGARAYALAMGVAYVALGILGLLHGSDEAIQGGHLALGALGLMAGTR